MLYNTFMAVTKPVQIKLPFPISPEVTARAPKIRTNGNANRLDEEDRCVHDWYRFVLSFPPHLVRDYLVRFQMDANKTLLDPFCGTGTSLVEAKRAGIPAIGLEANQFAFYASSIKVDWSTNGDGLEKCAHLVAGQVLQKLAAQGIDDERVTSSLEVGQVLRTLAPETEKLLITNSISLLPLHKSLVLIDQIDEIKEKEYFNHLRLAFANALVFRISNLHFGPEVGVGKPKIDVPVVAYWLAEVEKMAADLRRLSLGSFPTAKVYLADSRKISKFIPPSSVDAVITSPPYPNEKDYTRTTRLESVLLGFIKTRDDLRRQKMSLVRSNTRGVYKGDNDDDWVRQNPEIQRIANEIEKRRVEMGKDSGFERQYSKVTRLYFGGMARHLADLRGILRPGARLAYVVGDQASYLRVMIRTGELLADIARGLGYEVEGIDLFRTRFATASQEQLREEVLVLRWPG